MSPRTAEDRHSKASHAMKRETKHPAANGRLTWQPQGELLVDYGHVSRCVLSTYVALGISQFNHSRQELYHSHIARLRGRYVRLLPEKGGVGQ